MPLTRHQRFHLDATIREAEANKLESREMRVKLSESKELEERAYDAYNDEVIRLSQEIIDTRLFPSSAREPSEVHDYIENQAAATVRLRIG